MQTIHLNGFRIIDFVAANTLLILLLSSISLQAQDAAQDEKKEKGASSYDQISPVLLGQQSFQEMMAKDKAAKAGIMARQKQLLEERYNLTSKPHENAKMSRGKPIQVGPTAKLTEGITWEQ